MSTITFVTGNPGKLREAKEILGVDLVSKTCDIPELQLDTSAEVAYYKAKEAAKIIGGPVLVDDTALHFNAIGGLPGTYIRSFTDRLTPANIARILLGFEDKSARVTCSLGYCAGPDAEPQVFTGECPGTIVSEPRGSGGFGFDPIFQPEGYNQTYAELSSEIKNKISHRARAFELIKKSGILNSK